MGWRLVNKWCPSGERCLFSYDLHVADSTGLEREVKLESKRQLDLERLGGEPLEHRSFVSTYHDTSDHLLERCGITLRRRLENGRNDWQLKLPSDGARREVEAPGAPSGPPAAITDLLPALLHGRELGPLASLRTSRDGVLVQSGAGSAEVVIDDVAVLDGQRVTKTFGEIEIELIAGGKRTLKTIERAVKRLGARRTDGRTKIARALGTPGFAPTRPKTDDERIALYFAQCYVDLLTADPGVRLGIDAEPVHDLRVAVRRLRALLRTARAMIARDWADRVRGELDWLGRALGPLRDLDVLTAHLRAEAEALPELDRASLSTVFAALDADRAAARADALAALGSDRYFALLDVLAAPPPLVDSPETLEGVARKQLRKLHKTMRNVDSNSPDELLHQARISAKRMRYVAEALGDGRVVRRAKAFQDVVGEHQDAVVADQRLHDLADRVPASALTLGVLIERQRERRARTRGDLPESWKRLRRAAANAWT
jgi:CHAD domain-containing protein